MSKKNKIKPPVLIAHRGYSGRYPENTLLSYSKAYHYGARYMELDLQMTQDRVPFLQHDANLTRMSGVDVDIRSLKAKEVMKFRASYPGRFADAFADNRFTPLEKMLDWLKSHPDVTLFVEFKSESLEQFGVAVFVDEVYRLVQSRAVEQQCVFISFVADVIVRTKQISQLRTGWVLPEWKNKHLGLVMQSKPTFLFCDKNFLPQRDEDIWQGDWLWAIYNLDDVPSAIAMANRNMGYLETNEIGLLMQSDELTNNEL